MQIVQPVVPEDIMAVENPVVQVLQVEVVVQHTLLLLIEEY